jgi:probable phosphoglycerate mutase
MTLARIPVLFLRHGRTAWNAEGRIQGRRDVGLSRAGRALLAGRRVPAPYGGFDWYVTPLRRTAETASMMGIDPVGIEPRLAELDWGEWEGSTRAELRARYGRAFGDMEQRGLDFRPCGGESSRELRARLLAWLQDASRSGRPLAAVTHKGVIQMALAVATGWDLVSRRPHRLLWDRAHLFGYDPGARTLAISRLDIELEGPCGSPDGTGPASAGGSEGCGPGS